MADNAPNTSDDSPAYSEFLLPFTMPDTAAGQLNTAEWAGVASDNGDLFAYPHFEDGDPLPDIHDLAFEVLCDHFLDYDGGSGAHESSVPGHPAPGFLPNDTSVAVGDTPFHNSYTQGHAQELQAYVDDGLLSSTEPSHINTKGLGSQTIEESGVRPSETPKDQELHELDYDDTTDADAEGSEVEEPTELRYQSPGQSGETTKQCQRAKGCGRPARYLAGKYDGKRLCTRHGNQWETANSGSPTWRPLVFSIDNAMKAIRPNIVPPPSYSGVLDNDPSLIDHQAGLGAWTVRFHHAAMTPYKGEDKDHAESKALLTHQKTFDRKAMSRRNKEYREQMIGARMSLLFPIAQRFHQGGAAIYGISGDNSGYSEDTSLSFVRRLEQIEDVLKANKRVVMDVIEGRGVEAFVRGPRAFEKRKRTNKKGNAARQDRLDAADLDEADASRRPSVGPAELGDLPQGAGNRITAPLTDISSPALVAPRKRKRAVKDEPDIVSSAREQTAPPRPKKTPAPRKRATASAAPVTASPSNDTPKPDMVQFGPTILDAEMYLHRQGSSDTQQIEYNRSSLPPPTGYGYAALGGLPNPSRPQSRYPNPVAANTPSSPYPQASTVPRPDSPYPSPSQYQQHMPGAGRIFYGHQPQSPAVAQRDQPGLLSQQEWRHRETLFALQRTHEGERSGADGRHVEMPIAAGSSAPRRQGTVPSTPSSQQYGRSGQGSRIDIGGEGQLYVGGKRYANQAGYDRRKPGS